MANDEGTTARLARIEEKIDAISDSISDLKADMKIGRNERSDLDRRVTKLETKMEDVDTVKRAVIGVFVGLAIAIIVGVAIVAQYIQLP